MGWVRLYPLVGNFIHNHWLSFISLYFMWRPLLGWENWSGDKEAKNIYGHMARKVNRLVSHTARNTTQVLWELKTFLLQCTFSTRRREVLLLAVILI